MSGEEVDTERVVIVIDGLVLTRRHCIDLYEKSAQDGAGVGLYTLLIFSCEVCLVCRWGPYALSS